MDKETYVKKGFPDITLRTMEKEFNLSEEREKWHEELKYFFSKIDFANSFLDARAIKFMNEMTMILSNQDKEFIKRRNELDYMLQKGLIDLGEYQKRRDKLAGKDLV